MKNKKKKILIFITTVLIAVILIVLNFSSKNEEKKIVETETVSIPVSVLDIKPDSYRASLTLLGEVVPQWQTMIRTQVNGQIIFLSPRFREGEIVEKDEILIRIEDYQYRANVAEAELRLINAEISLLNEELSQRKQFMEAAQKEVDAAKIYLDLVKNELEKTIIRAPYRGIIVERSINKGEVLFAGGDVAMLYGIDKSTVSISLNSFQWEMLPEDFNEIEVTLIDSESNHKWNAHVSREGQRLKRESRLRPLYIEIKNPLQLDPPLLSGTFLNVRLKGRLINELLEIPGSALTKVGYIWFIKDGRLQSLKADPIFRENNNVYIKRSENIPDPILIANAPNSAFIDGMSVTAEILKGEE